jgi:hypothetical protein
MVYRSALGLRKTSTLAPIFGSTGFSMLGNLSCPHVNVFRNFCCIEMFVMDICIMVIGRAIMSQTYGQFSQKSTMASIDKSFWRYGLFQIPAIVLGACLLAAAILSVIAFPCALFWRLLVWALVAASLTWTLILPLDRLLELQTQLPMNLRGQIALGNALFWSALILSLMLSRLPPLWAACSIDLSTKDSQQISLNWSQWHAMYGIIFLHEGSHPTPNPVGVSANFGFTVTQD